MQTYLSTPPPFVAKRIDFSLLQHSTNVAGLFAYERDNNFYYAQTTKLGFSLLPSLPQPYNAASPHTGTSLSLAHAGWQGELKNESIFRYLLPTDSFSTSLELSAFVKEWYQTSCAIIFLAETGEPQIIGTGTLIGPTQVVTARHNFQHIPANRLYVRFFSYEVESVEMESHDVFVKEKYLDIPVTTRFFANNGFDAGWLILPEISPQLSKRYMKTLPLITPDGFMDGRYMMFHFAGGTHQISTGEVKSNNPYYSTLHTDIEIHAGPGASGATVLRLDPLSQTVSGCAISIFRMMQNEWPERRLLTFHRLYAYLRNQPNEVNPDRICAPYYYDQHFSVIPTNAFIQPGYEFVYYRDEIYGHNGPRPPKPANIPHYTLVDDATHSNHHIIPIRDLVFLWDYFHEVDSQTNQNIARQVEKKITREKQKMISALRREINSQSLDHMQSTWMWHQGHQDIENTLVTLKQTWLKEEKDKILKSYHGNILALFIQLCPEEIEGRNRFAWAYWNLFQGWKESYRTDDSRYEQDPSEKTKPLGFNQDIWNALKNEQTGLYRNIQALIRVNTNPPQRPKVESDVIASLNKLSGIWGKCHPKIVYRYNPHEWLQVGYKNDHPVYEIRKK